MSASPLWHEDDAFWQALEPVMFPPERVAAAADDVTKICALAKVAAKSRVLDMPTGSGRHALALARAGMRVTGVDRTTRYIERARREAGAAGVEVEYLVGDMRIFNRPGAFDVALNLYSSFGYFPDAENLAQARGVRASLVSGGAAVFEMVGKEILAKTWSARAWHEVGDSLLLEERTVEADWARVTTRWIVVGPTGRHEHTFQLRVFSGPELRDTLLNAGFARVDLYGSLDGAPYDVNGKRLVAVARA